VWQNCHMKATEIFCFACDGLLMIAPLAPSTFVFKCCSCGTENVFQDSTQPIGILLRRPSDTPALPHRIDIAPEGAALSNPPASLHSV